MQIHAEVDTSALRVGLFTSLLMTHINLFFITRDKTTQRPTLRHSVRLSVRLPVTLRCFIKMAKYRFVAVTL